MSTQGKIEIKECQEWMLDQVVALNVQQYGGDPEESRYSLERICSESFVSSKSVPVVAMDGETVVGVQTYRYWPYSYEDKIFYSLQSGGTLVKSTHRGQGLFMQMLSRGNDLLINRGVDFVTGFPVQMSFGGFIKDGWTHLCSPTWFVKVLKPAQLVMERFRGQQVEAESVIPACFESTIDLAVPMERCLSTKRITPSTSLEVLKYRYCDARPGKYLFWKYHGSGANIVFMCKLSRARGYYELLLGDVLSDSEISGVLTRAFLRFLSDVKKSAGVCAVTILVGGRTIEWLPLLLGNGFVPIPKRIKFIVKKVGLPQEGLRLIENWRNWSLMQADLDTW